MDRVLFDIMEKNTEKNTNPDLLLILNSKVRLEDVDLVSNYKKWNRM